MRLEKREKSNRNGGEGGRGGGGEGKRGRSSYLMEDDLTSLPMREEEKKLYESMEKNKGESFSQEGEGGEGIASLPGMSPSKKGYQQTGTPHREGGRGGRGLSVKSRRGGPRRFLIAQKKRTELERGGKSRGR